MLASISVGSSSFKSLSSVISGCLNKAFESKFTLASKQIIFFSLVLGFLPILDFLVLIENVPNLEIFTLLFFFKVKTINEKNSSIRFSSSNFFYFSKF